MQYSIYDVFSILPSMLVAGNTLFASIRYSVLPSVGRFIFVVPTRFYYDCYLTCGPGIFRPCC